jgi:hypothetical protein
MEHDLKPLDFRKKRPYVMMHEGRELFANWFSQLVSVAETEQIPIDDVADLSTAAHIIVRRLIAANDQVRPDLMEPEIEFIRAYTAMDAFAGRVNPKDRLKRHLDDGIWFFTNVPLSIACDTWMHSQLRSEPISSAVKEMLSSPSFGDCMEKVATTGFGVLRNNFGNINSHDGGRIYHRQQLEAAEDDPEMIQVSMVEGQAQYRLAEWAASSLLNKLRQQNKNWPDDDAAGILQCGQMRDMLPPISAGCPVRKVAVKPLCQYLAAQIRPIEAQN